MGCQHFQTTDDHFAHACIQARARYFIENSRGRHRVAALKSAAPWGAKRLCVIPPCWAKNSPSPYPSPQGCPPVPPTFFPQYVSAHSGPASSRNTIPPPPPRACPNLGPVLRQHWKTLCFSTFLTAGKAQNVETCLTVRLY